GGTKLRRSEITTRKEDGFRKGSERFSREEIGVSFATPTLQRSSPNSSGAHRSRIQHLWKPRTLRRLPPTNGHNVRFEVTGRVASISFSRGICRGGQTAKDRCRPRAAVDNRVSFNVFAGR